MFDGGLAYDHELMSTAAKSLSLIAVGVLVYFVLLVTLWAARPLEDYVFVGVDWTPTTEVPPQSQKERWQRVECNTVFDSEPRSDEPLPALTPQPEGRQALAYPQDVCEHVHSNGRLMFVVDTVIVLVALAVIAVIALRLRSQQSPVAPVADAVDHSSLRE